MPRRSSVPLHRSARGIRLSSRETRRIRGAPSRGPTRAGADPCTTGRAPPPARRRAAGHATAGSLPRCRAPRSDKVQRDRSSAADCRGRRNSRRSDARPTTTRRSLNLPPDAPVEFLRPRPDRRRCSPSHGWRTPSSCRRPWLPSGSRAIPSVPRASRNDNLRPASPGRDHRNR